MMLLLMMVAYLSYMLYFPPTSSFFLVYNLLVISVHPDFHFFSKFVIDVLSKQFVCYCNCSILHTATIDS